MSKKSKFVGNLIEKLYLNKILNQLADDNQSELTSKCDLSKYYVKSCDFLNEKLKRGSPVPFVLNENEDCLFLFNDGPAKKLCFRIMLKL